MSSASGPRLRASAGRAAGGEQAGLGLLAFFGLAAFAAVRYSTLIATPPAGRAVLIAACVTAGCAFLVASGHIHGSGPILALLRLALVLGTFALSMLALHIPAHLLAPGQWHHLADRLSSGTQDLSGWLWPYRGGDRWAQVAVLLPVPAALLTAGCAWFWPSRTLLATRRALALAALLAIFVTGTANAPASVPAFDGVVLMALLAATVLAPLTAASEIGRALCWLAACAGIALAVQAALRSDGPWIHYREPSAAAATTAGVTFQWAQLYGPDVTPRTQAPMMIVSEQQPELLRMTSLDTFDGLRFLRSAAPPGSPTLDEPAATAGRWSEHAVVEIRGLRSALLASGGGLPTRIRAFDGLEPIPAEQADGTASTPTVASSGASYEVVSYDPQPSPQAARRAPRAYPRAYLPYAQFDLPGPGASALVPPNLGAEALAPPAGARLVGPSAPGLAPASNPQTRALIEASPYAPMFALARGLAKGAASDYDIAQHIERYLQSTYGYDRAVPLTRYPLEEFLFGQRRGYCQQFSGAMVLMLRMDGVPARVGVGFLPTVRGPRAGTWQIRASDAHAWAEVFLSGIGWVSFDPTPATPAGSGAENTALSRSAVFGAGSPANGHRAATTSTGKARSSRGHGSGLPLAAILLGLAALLALGASARVGIRARRRRRHEPAEDPALAELRRALVRLGRARPGLTLSQLEQSLERDGHARAAAYVGGLARRRFQPDAETEARPAGRGQLRRALAPRGIAGRARALAALPPKWVTPAPRGRSPQSRSYPQSRVRSRPM
jgi:transglutaminase-like putative cysteine protease